jgi:hypothetical protein
MSSLPQTTGNALINCINAAHKKYESNAMDWQMVIEIGWCLLTRVDMERFEQMCEDGLLGPSDYRIFEDWSAIDRLRDGYLRIKDGLVLEGEIQEMKDKENHYDVEMYKARVHAFFLAYHEMRTYRWWLSFRPTDLECYRKFEVSLERVMFYAHLLILFVLRDKKKLALVRASGKYERSTGSPVNHWYNGRACQEC